MSHSLHACTHTRTTLVHDSLTALASQPLLLHLLAHLYGSLVVLRLLALLVVELVQLLAPLLVRVRV